MNALKLAVLVSGHFISKCQELGQICTIEIKPSTISMTFASQIISNTRQCLIEIIVTIPKKM